MYLNPNVKKPVYEEAGTLKLVGTDAVAIVENVKLLTDNKYMRRWRRRIIFMEDGKACEKIVNLLKFEKMDTQNVNTKEYWNHRFHDCDENSWEKKSGEQQTRIFAHYIAKQLTMPCDFTGTILDYGCALGDAVPLYKKYYPKANFIGADFSVEAIEKCKKKFGNIATFITCDVENVPPVDVIIASNIFEHLSNDKECILKLLQKCNDLFIAVPYNEKLTKKGEHVNSYNSESFNYLSSHGKKVNSHIYLCRGYKYKDILRSYYNIELKNFIRPLFDKQKTKGGVYLQILFHITDSK